MGEQSGAVAADLLTPPAGRGADGATRAQFDAPGARSPTETEGGLASGRGIHHGLCRSAGAGRMPPLIQIRIANAGVEINSVQVREPDLEAVFLHLTGRALRD
jgi:hypothetical protein